MRSPQHMLITHSGELKQFRWPARAYLENVGGLLAIRGTRAKEGAARATSTRPAGKRAG